MRKGLTVIAGLVAVSFAATPFVIGTTTARATAGQTDTAAPVAAAAPAEVVSVPPAAACKKVRVVYGGYADPATACGTASR